MNNSAIVNRIEEHDIYLMHISDYGKKEKTEREFWNIKKYDFRSLNPNSLDLREGDAVEYYIPTLRKIAASFLMLILPLILFMTSFSLMLFLGMKSEKLIALVSTSVMIGSFYLSKLFKRIGYKETLPYITKIITKEDLSKIKSSCADCGSCTACG